VGVLKDGCQRLVINGTASVSVQLLTRLFCTLEGRTSGQRPTI
jgi:hypothetical protein